MWRQFPTQHQDLHAFCIAPYFAFGYIVDQSGNNHNRFTGRGCGYLLFGNFELLQSLFIGFGVVLLQAEQLRINAAATGQLCW